ncbi:alpha-S1-casein [Grammomys surdaster]|uniref:alpha-S1-casein n=1 Tax=Grammomys surdaster TaxID=491861 RepID=UPI0010A038B6|nr:alpha-S1-casein [Grammomys surdaster]
MKLLLLTCLVAAALAMPRLHHKNAVSSQTQQQHSSSEEIVKQPKYLSINEQRALLTEEENNEIKEQAMASAQESEDAIPSIAEEHLQSKIKYNQLLKTHPMSVVDQSLPQFFQYDAYPLWTYVPQDVHYITPEAVLTTFTPIVPKDAEKTNEWW